MIHTAVQVWQLLDDLLSNTAFNSRCLPLPVSGATATEHVTLERLLLLQARLELGELVAEVAAAAQAIECIERLMMSDWGHFAISMLL